MMVNWPWRRRGVHGHSGFADFQAVAQHVEGQALALEPVDAQDAVGAGDAAVGQDRHGQVALNTVADLQAVELGGRHVHGTQQGVDAHGAATAQAQTRGDGTGDRRTIGAGVEEEFVRPLAVQHHRCGHAQRLAVGFRIDVRFGFVDLGAGEHRRFGLRLQSLLSPGCGSRRRARESAGDQTAAGNAKAGHDLVSLPFICEVYAQNEILSTGLNVRS
jgi:hypothetical protein